MSIQNLYKSLSFITSHPLNRDHKFQSIIRYLKWQISSKLAPGAIVYEWLNGSKLVVRRSELGLTGNIYTGLHEFSDMAYLLHVLRPEDLFVDVGANAGSYTVLACSVVGANGYSFEPVPHTFKRLVENLRLNHIENRVKCFNMGVGNEQGYIAFTSDRDTGNHVLASGEQDANAITVEIATLDTALEKEFPSLLKIDVEGFETPVLEGAAETLKKHSLHSVIMELNGRGSHYGYDESRILEMMFDYGFKTFVYEPFKRTLVNLKGKNLDSGNTLFIRDEPLVVKRLEGAPKYTIHGKEF